MRFAGIGCGTSSSGPRFTGKLAARRPVCGFVRFQVEKPDPALGISVSSRLSLVASMAALKDLEAFLTVEGGVAGPA